MADERTLTIRAVAHSASRRELQQALVSWVAAATADKAVRQARVFEDVLDPSAFEVEAAMDDAAGLQAHVRSPGFGALLGALTVLAHEVDVSVCQRDPVFGADALGMVRRLRSQRCGPDDSDSGRTRRDR